MLHLQAPPRALGHAVSARYLSRPRKAATPSPIRTDTPYVTSEFFLPRARLSSARNDATWPRFLTEPRTLRPRHQETLPITPAALQVAIPAVWRMELPASLRVVIPAV